MIFCVLCWRWLGLLFSVLNVSGLPLCARRQTLSAGDRLFGSWPLTLPTATEEVERRLSAVAQSIPPPPALNTQPWGSQAASLSGCFSANLWHPSTKLKLTGLWDGGRELGHERRPARTVWPAVGGSRSSSQPTCLYYIVLTKSLCLTTPFLYSNGETLSVYVFDICTNAPLWKRKWNLDISGIKWQFVSLFELQRANTQLNSPTIPSAHS